jgi:threonine dehydrogenase-like Zn-dependent dehydrogenase
MKALCWNGVNSLAVETVPEPKILNPGDALVRVKLSSVCGSDLHLLDGYVPTMRAGDIIGHEFLGEVVDTGSNVRNLRTGDRVIVVSIIGCGHCWFCEHAMWSLCDNSNPNRQPQEAVYGKVTAGIFGYSHAFGGYAGSHAEFVRVPYADHNAFKVPNDIPDEKAVFVSDAAPTGFYAADLCGIRAGDVIAVWGCGGVGQMAIRSAYLLGAERVIAIDRFPDRLEKAKERAGAEILNYEDVSVLEALDEMTGGRGPDACIDAVGMEADATGVEDVYDRTKQYLRLQSDRPHVLRQAILACRKGGTVSIIGVYGGLVDKFPIGVAMNKGLTLRMGQQPGQNYAGRLFDHIRRGELDPSYLLTHRLPLDDGPRGYAMFKHKEDDCLRVAFAP